MADKQSSEGRGKLLMAMLQRKREAQTESRPGPQPELQEPKARGRAALLQKLQQHKEKKAGGGDAVARAEPKPGPSREVEILTGSVADLSVAESETFHYRGQRGTPIRATANYIFLDVEPDRGVFEYEIRFQPDIDAKSNRRKILNTVLGDLGATKVYDGDVCLYLPSRVFAEKRSFSSVIPTSGESVEVMVIYKRKKRMGECLHLYNVLFKRIMSILLYSRIGKNYFDTDPRQKKLVPQHKLEVLPGYAVHVDEMEGGLTVCLDTQHRVIRSQTVYEFLQEVRASSDPRHFKENIMKSVVGACVLTRYNNKSYIVDDICWELTPKDTFALRDGSECTFVNYYKNHHNIVIEDVDQPMLVNRREKNVGQAKVEHMVCLVPELSYLTGLTDAMRSDFKVMKDVAAHTRITPSQRMLSMRNYLQKVEESEACQKVMAGWGLRIAGGSADVPARVLPPEVIYFGGPQGQQRTDVRGTDWNKAAGDNQMCAPIDFTNWQLFYTARDERFAANFEQTMMRLAKGMGCRIGNARHVLLANDRTETYMSTIGENINTSVQFAVFICPTIRTDRYNIIKKMCCVQLPIASQVILSKTLANQQKVRTIIHKIAMQITCKLGGTLWSVRIPVSGWMVCGIDVCHGVNQSSVCGFVCSMNDSMTKYYSQAMFQEREIGDFFKMAFRRALQQFREQMGTFPLKVVIYRDGVGDGQLDHCKRYELPQFEEVIREFNLTTTVTFLVIQKRINTRIFRVLEGGRDYENPPSGTVVDSVVTRRNMYDFFLVPQSVRQGTVNPTHYVVLHDGGDIKPDHLQILSYKLCHLYYNWSGTIRVPAPCQYAHKLAALVGQNIKKTPSASLADKLYYL